MCKSFWTVPREKYRVKRRIRHGRNRMYNIYERSLSLSLSLYTLHSHAHTAHAHLYYTHTIFTQTIVLVSFSFPCVRVNSIILGSNIRERAAAGGWERNRARNSKCPSRVCIVYIIVNFYIYIYLYTYYIIRVSSTYLSSRYTLFVLCTRTKSYIYSVLLTR